MTPPPTSATRRTAPAGLARRPGRVIVAARDAAGVCTPLRDTEATVHAVADGTQALALLRERSADVLILGWDDGLVDGEALCRTLRADVRAADTWTIALVDAWERGAAALAKGADDCIVRPFGAAELTARVALGVKALR